MKTVILNLETSVKSGSYSFISDVKVENTVKENLLISGSVLNKNYFENVIFCNCEFQASAIKDAKFVNCLFINCNFNFCKLENCNFISCTIEGSYFYLTNSLNCNFLSCTYKNTEWVQSVSKDAYIFNSNMDMTAKDHFNYEDHYEAVAA
ncbi:MAG: pentapeptide repeat-containing protein [Bacteriovoracaceae bacterium]|nr:pentapeptide repeat-containing protein [Bacteriovoracaceae bacterium]